MPPRTVMVVEDNDAIRQAMTDLLEDEGYTVRAARNGRDALRQIEAERPAVIVLDIAMPEMSGVELRNKLIEEGRGDIPVIVVTASQKAREAYQVPVDAWLQKPFDISQLFDLIHDLAGRP